MTGREDPSRWGLISDVSLHPEIGHRCAVLLILHFARGDPAAWKTNKHALEQVLEDAAYGVWPHHLNLYSKDVPG